MIPGARLLRRFAATLGLGLVGCLALGDLAALLGVALLGGYLHLAALGARALSAALVLPALALSPLLACPGAELTLGNQLQLPLRYVDSGNPHGHYVSQAIRPARHLAADQAPLALNLPPVVAEVLQPHQPLDEEPLGLDENPEVRHARNHPVERLAQARLQELKHQHVPKLVAGRLGLAIGRRAMLTEFHQAGHVVGGEVLELAPAVRLDHPVDRQVGVSADRAGEVAVVLRRQREVADTHR